MRVGSLFSGYGGLDMAVGGDLAWYSEIEPAACKVMEAHHPGVPNLGDITKVNWSEVEPVDVITGGYPCQPFSNAGARKGTNDERHLWPHVRDALSAIRPRAAVLENVRGHLTLGFDVVLADLADLGWSARWGVVRAADAGAPHNRERLFIVAHPDGASGQTYDDGRQGRGDARRPQPVERGGTTTAHPNSDTNGKERNAGRVGNPVSSHEQGRDASVRGRRNPHGHQAGTWGPYEAAINRWEHTLGRPAPTPTIHRAGRDRLNPKFVEWMMGLNEGWVTGHGLTASQELKMLGNGVVPQQARLALDLLAAA